MQELDKVRNKLSLAHRADMIKQGGKSHDAKKYNQKMEEQKNNDERVAAYLESQNRR